MEVFANVVSSCTVTGFPMNFGPINPLAEVLPTAVSKITAVCSEGTAYTIGLGNGVTGASFDKRVMTNLLDASIKLKYQLHKDSIHTAPWGNTDTTPHTGNGLPQDIPVYGQLAGPFIPGTYTDNVIITVTY